MWDLAIATTTVGATDTCKTLTDTYGENHLYVSAEWGGVGANGNWNLGASGGQDKALCQGSFTWQHGV